MFNAIFIKFFKLHIQENKLFAFRPNMEGSKGLRPVLRKISSPKFSINLEPGPLPIDWHGQRRQVKNARGGQCSSSSESSR
jgi:hypothetical protein